MSSASKLVQVFFLPLWNLTHTLRWAPGPHPHVKALHGWHWRTWTQDLQSQEQWKTPATAPHSPSLLVMFLRFPGTSGHLDQPWFCSRALFASDDLVPSLSSPGLCLFLPPARLHGGGWHAAPPRGASARFPDGISVAQHPTRPLLCQPHHNCRHAQEPLLPPAYSLAFRVSSDTLCLFPL